MSNKKHYIITSLTLGAIALSSAALVGLTNLITKDKIIENEQNKIKSGISKIFGENSVIKSEENLPDKYTYSKTIYFINDSNNNPLGRAIKTIGSNMYGEISLLIGFTNHLAPVISDNHMLLLLLAIIVILLIIKIEKLMMSLAVQLMGQN